MKAFSFLTFLVIPFFFTPPETVTQLTLNEALDQGLITAEVAGKGGHSGECLKLKLINNQRKDLEIVIPAGQIFEAGDSSLQNLMVAKEETLLVERDKDRIAHLYAFCIEAMDGSPGEGSGFVPGRMATGNLLAFARYLSSNRQYGNPSAQSAVWAISDEERLESIGDPQLAKNVAQLLGKPEPQYHIQYRQPDRDRLLPGTPAVLQREALSMNGLFYYTLERDKRVNFELYNEAGEKVHAFFENRRQIKGYHKFRFEFEIWNLPQGKYFARLTSGGEVLKELSVVF